jgi:polysaccharide export outer membrane protein
VSIRSAAYLFLAFCVSACSSVPGGMPIVESGDRYVAAESGIEDYRLGAGDKVRVTVFNEPTLSGEFSVSTTGTLSLPLVGDITADGKQPADVATEFQRRLAEGYIREPKVSAEVISYRPFFILGEVRAPGQYPYASNLTVMNAIATAQGFTPRANHDYAFVRKSGSTQEQAFRLSPDLRVMPGDTVRIGERFF